MANEYEQESDGETKGVHGEMRRGVVARISGVTSEYVYRMWGGSVSMEVIEEAMAALRQAQELVRRMM